MGLAEEWAARLARVRVLELEARRETPSVGQIGGAIWRYFNGQPGAYEIRSMALLDAMFDAFGYSTFERTVDLSFGPAFWEALDYLLAQGVLRNVSGGTSRHSRLLGRGENFS